MDTINSFKGYDKVNQAENQAFRRKARRRIITIVVSSILLAAIVITAVVGTLLHKRSNNDDNGSAASSGTLKAVCGVTQYPDSCFSSISTMQGSNSTNDPEVIFKLSLLVALDELSRLRDLPTAMIQGEKDLVLRQALNVCAVVLDDAVGQLNDSVSSMVVGQGGQLLSASKIDDLSTWLSSVITGQQTCLDALQELDTTEHYNSTVLDQLQTAMKNSTEFASNSLAIITKILTILSDFNIPIHRKLLGHNVGADDEFPGWLSSGDRRLLQAANSTSTTQPDLVVADDGTGHYKSIGEAVAAIPRQSSSRFVIYVKAGKYVENVALDSSRWNVMMYGDGINKTVVSGSLNFVDGTPTFSTASFAVMGKGFMAKGMTFMNTAGPIKQQAVAFLSGSDLSVYYQCAFDAFQDTLYAYSGRQFYRDCIVTGTVDFIFGNAAVVFQNTAIQPRQPLAYQFNTITAQGKTDPNQNTGISIQNCTISANGNITVATYLGRPWKNLSTTVLMESYIGALLNPLGWTPWVSGVDPPKTIFYGEYENTGPGSSVDGRVNWAGYYPRLTRSRAEKFTVGSFIQGSKWLPATTVAYELTLA